MCIIGILVLLLTCGLLLSQLSRTCRNESFQNSDKDYADTKNLSQYDPSIDVQKYDPDIWDTGRYIDGVPNFRMWNPDIDVKMTAAQAEIKCNNGKYDELSSSMRRRDDERAILQEKIVTRDGIIVDLNTEIVGLKEEIKAYEEKVTTLEDYIQHLKKISTVGL